MRIPKVPSFPRDHRPGAPGGTPPGKTSHVHPTRNRARPLLRFGFTFSPLRSGTVRPTVHKAHGHAIAPISRPRVRGRISVLGSGVSARESEGARVVLVW